MWLHLAHSLLPSIPHPYFLLVSTTLVHASGILMWTPVTLPQCSSGCRSMLVPQVRQPRSCSTHWDWVQLFTEANSWWHTVSLKHSSNNTSWKLLILKFFSQGQFMDEPNLRYIYLVTIKVFLFHTLQSHIQLIGMITRLTLVRCFRNDNILL